MAGKKPKGRRVLKGAHIKSKQRGNKRAAPSSQANRALRTENAERRQLEAALRESEQRYRSMVAAMAEGIVMQNQDGHIDWCNASACRILGLTQAQVLGRTSLDLRWRAIHEDGSPFPGETHPAMVTLRTGCASENVVMGVHRPDGSLVWISINTQPIMEGEGEQLSGVVASFRDITVQKQAEEHSRQSEAFVTSVLEHLPHMVFVKEASELRFVRLNKAGEVLLGRGKGELLGKTDYDIFPKLHADFFTSKDREVLANGSLLDITEETIQTARGPRILHTKKLPILGVEGTPRYLLGISEDITEQKQTEEHLLRTQFAMDQAVDAVYWIDPQANILYTNEAASAMLGYTKEEFSRMTVHDLNPDFPRERWPGFWEETRETRTMSFESVHLAKDGRRIPIDIRVSFLAYEGQEFHCAFVRDLTERKRVDEALRASRERFELAARATNDGIWDWNIVTGDLCWSDRNFELFGLRPGELIPSYDVWIAVLHPDDADRARQAVSHHLDTREPYDIELRVRMKDGSYRWFRDQGQAVWDAIGRPVRMVGSISDVTERRTAEEALRTAHVELEQRVVERTTQLAFANQSLQQEIVERRRAEKVLQLTQFTVDRAAQGIFWVGPHAEILYANDAACDVLGYSRDELLRMTVPDIDPNFPAEAWPSHWEELKQRGAFTFESSQHTKGGGVRYTEVTVNYLEYEGQEYNCAIVRDVTDRKLNEVALSESEERFSKAFNESAIGMAIVALDGRWLQVNQALCEIVGYSKAELYASTFQAITHPDDLDANLRYMQQVLSGALRTYQMEKRYFHKNGSIIWIVLNVSLVRNVDGTPKHFISQIQDISERKQIEDRLRATQYAVDHAADQIFVIGPTGNFLDVNGAACRRLGYAKQELLTMSVMDIDPDYPREVWPQHWAEFRQTGQLRFETRHCTKSGEIYPVEITANYHVHKGLELEYAIVRDLTERRQAEAAIRDSELRYKLLTEATFDGIAIHDQGTLLEVNAGLERMFGYEPGELVGRSIWDLIADESRDLVLANMKKGVLGPYEAIGRRKDGTTFPGEVVVRLYQYRGKEVRLVAGRDITERKYLEQERLRRTEELERQIATRTAEIAKLESQRAQTERLVAMGRLAAGVAHEINNPIAGIKNAFTLVRQAVDPAHPNAEFAGLIDREIARVAAIIQNMYQLFRPETRADETVDVWTLVKDLEALLTPLLQQRRLKFEVDLMVSVQWLCLSRGDLMQVLLNLLSNAIECSPEGGTITFSLREETGGVRLSVRDQGSGIGAEHLPHIFDPFYTTKTGRHQKGMGLGLSVSQSLVQAMGGTIEIETELHRGSTFTLCLPRERVKRETMGSREASFVKREEQDVKCEAPEVRGGRLEVRGSSFRPLT